MATVNIAFGRAMSPSDMGPAPVFDAHARSRTVASTTSSASPAGFTARSAETVCQVTTTGGAIWVKFGASPTVTVDGDDCFLILDGQTREFGRIAKGDTIALRDDA